MDRKRTGTVSYYGPTWAERRCRTLTLCVIVLAVVSAAQLAMLLEHASDRAVVPADTWARSAVIQLAKQSEAKDAYTFKFIDALWHDVIAAHKRLDNCAWVQRALWRRQGYKTYPDPPGERPSRPAYPDRPFFPKLAVPR